MLTIYRSVLSTIVKLNKIYWYVTDQSIGADIENDMKNFYDWYQTLRGWIAIKSDIVLHLAYDQCTPPECY